MSFEKPRLSVPGKGSCESRIRKLRQSRLKKIENWIFDLVGKKMFSLILYSVTRGPVDGRPQRVPQSLGHAQGTRESRPNDAVAQGTHASQTEYGSLGVASFPGSAFVGERRF